MAGATLELRCPKNILGLSIEPQPDWTFDTLISELNAIEMKLNNSISDSSPLLKKKASETASLNENRKESATFVMRFSYDEIDEFESNDEHTNEVSLKTGTRFSCSELDLSDSEDSQEEFDHEKAESHLMDKPGKVEGILLEAARESRLRVQEEILSRLSLLEADLRNETDRSISNLVRVQKCIEGRREINRKLDKQYQRQTAEALDNHLSALQRDHEQMSQIEERRIRNDAAFEEAKRKATFEEAKRKEKALQEEKARQEKAKSEAEAKLLAARAAEEARKAAMDLERKAQEAIEREKRRNVYSNERSSSTEMKGGEQPPKNRSDKPSAVHSAGIIVKAAESALRFERERLQKHMEVIETNSGLKLNSNKDSSACERQITRLVKQISGTEENFRAKASALVNIINDPLVPQSIAIALFSKQVVSLCENPSVTIAATAFACGRMIVLVSSKFQVTMDLVLAEFHKACIYTVPKHIHYSESAFETKEAYWKAIGYREKDGKIENTAQYLERVESYMTLYAALVQTEISGIKNIHGLQEGWAWIARFLNKLPADLMAAAALLSFLRMAGFMMFRKYKSQFRKVLNVITREYLVALRKIPDKRVNQIIAGIETYIETNQFMQEPQGWRLQTSLVSKT